MGRCRNNNVGGASNNHCRNNVAGASDNHRNNNVAGVADTNFRVPVRASISGEDFCRAVRRCLNNNSVAGAEDSRQGNCRRRNFWF